MNTTRFGHRSTKRHLYNYKLLCSLTQGTHHICAVKADAYGHNAQICVRNLIFAGCDFFAVSCKEEAISVRKICKIVGSGADILILGYTSPNQACILAENNIIQTISSYKKRIIIKATFGDDHLSENADKRTYRLSVDSITTDSLDSFTVDDDSKARSNLTFKISLTDAPFAYISFAFVLAELVSDKGE